MIKKKNTEARIFSVWMISTRVPPSRKQMLLALKWSYKRASPLESDLRVSASIFVMRN